MAANRNTYNRGPPQNRDPEKAALLHEVIEALTALGNYLAVIQQKFEDHPAPQKDLGEALKKSLGQHERAGEAVRQLNDILHREAARNNNPGGIG